MLIALLVFDLVCQNGQKTRRVESCCLSYFPHCRDKIPDTYNLRKERFILSLVSVCSQLAPGPYSVVEESCLLLDG